MIVAGTLDTEKGRQKLFRNHQHRKTRLLKEVSQQRASRIF